MNTKRYNLSLNNKLTKGICGTNFFKDSDGDGVYNILDCRPFNPRMQHSRPNFVNRQRIKNAPVRVVLEDGERVHVLSKKARREEPETVKRFLKAVKEQPEVLGEIERNPNAAVNLTPDDEVASGQARMGRKKGEKHTIFVFNPKYYEEEKKRKNINRVKKALRERGMSEKQINDHVYHRLENLKYTPTTQRYAETIRHELEHTKQYEKAKRLKKTNKSAYTRYVKGFTGPYSERKREREAFDSQEKMINKRERLTYGARKYATKQFIRTMDNNTNNLY